MPWFVYILECKNKTLYTGITNNLKRRFSEHKIGEGGYYTKLNRPTKVLYYETFQTRSKALKREAEIKGWTKAKKIALIKGDLDLLKRL